MGRAQTETLLPIDTWAAIMGINLWEFNQIGTGFPDTNTQQCPHVWFQYQWQQDFLSREEIAQAIFMAEGMIAEQLGYPPAPMAIVGEKVPYPRTANRSTYGWGGNPRGQYKSVSLQWTHVQGGGILRRSLIGTVNVTLSDSDSDTVNDLFTSTAVATTVTNIDEIAVYFKATDRMNNVVDEQWRIRPVKVTISGGNVVVTGHSSLLVLPNLEVRTTADVLDVTSAAIYATQVEIYRLYRDDDYSTDNAFQGYAHWELQNCDTPPCGAETSPICIGARESEAGVVSVNFDVSSDYCQSREPDWLTVNYVAGIPLVDGNVDPQMAQIIAHLASAIIPPGNCACDRSNRILAYWKDHPGDSDRARFLSLKEIDENPWGPKNGAQYAWSRVKKIRDLRAATG